MDGESDGGRTMLESLPGYDCWRKGLPHGRDQLRLSLLLLRRAPQVPGGARCRDAPGGGHSLVLAGCRVPGEGIGDRYSGCRSAAPDYLVPVQVLSRALRGRLLTGIKALHEAGALARHLERLWDKEWTACWPTATGPRTWPAAGKRSGLSRRAPDRPRSRTRPGKRRPHAFWATIPSAARPADGNASCRLRRSGPTPDHRPARDPRHGAHCDRAPSSPAPRSQGECMLSQESCRLRATQCDEPTRDRGPTAPRRDARASCGSRIDQTGAAGTLSRVQGDPAGRD
jgi:hypothetical protein